jgi:hypothetical protein
MEELPSLERKVKQLENAFRGVANVRLKVEGLRDCYFQALLSRGGRGLSRLLAEMAEGSSLKKAAKTCGIDTDRLVRRTIPEDELLPWEIITSADQELLRREYGRAFGDQGERE